MASCITPITIQLKSGTCKSVAVPCGRCLHCKKRRANGWAFRLAQHYKDEYVPAHMLTLTYDTDHVPITPNGFMSLRSKDVQDFMKRLRYHTGQKLKYYCTGEYGGKYGRPHYHIIIFGLSDPLGHNLEKSWTFGTMHLAPLNEATIGYTLKYITKAQWRAKHDRDDREKPKSLMSKKLGANYITEEIIQWHKQDLLKRMYVVLDGDVKVSMPRYYKEKIYDTYERELIGMYFEQRQEFENQFLTETDKRNIEQYNKHTFTQIKEDDSVIF